MSQIAEANGTEKPAPKQEVLRPEFQLIVDRYGRDLFDAALRIASLTAALDYLLTRTSRIPQFTHMHPMVDAIAKGLADLNNELITAKGWHLVDVMECITEIGKAQREGVRIIVPGR